MTGDVIISVIISILFARRMLLLNASLNERRLSHFQQCPPNAPSVNVEDKNVKRKSHVFHDTILDNSTWIMLQRSTLLTFITLFTSQIAIGLGAVLKLEALWCSIDSMVNCWCIMLIFVVHDKIYNVLCGKLQDKIITVGFMGCWSCNCCCQIRDASKIVDDEKTKQNEKEIVEKVVDTPSTISTISVNV